MMIHPGQITDCPECHKIFDRPCWHAYSYRWMAFAIVFWLVVIVLTFVLGYFTLWKPIVWLYKSYIGVAHVAVPTL
jgi:hypothetical protein